MNANKRHVVGFLGSVLGDAVLSGVALAGNPHGAAPGQTKQTSSATVSASASVKTTARGQAKHQSSTHTTSTSAAGNATGVKSSSTTGFNASAPAGSSATKLYGNGRTARQIAEQKGASASTMPFGPGKSPPHKATLWPPNGQAPLAGGPAL